MIVRLAFSVAVNVNADILIVDEALAVGDAMLRRGMFRRIREMQEDGKTILYVGHDTEVVQSLCTHALLLDGGQVIKQGAPNTVVNKYYALIAERERTYSEGNLIEHGEVSGEGDETVYDFVPGICLRQRFKMPIGIPVPAANCKDPVHTPSRRSSRIRLRRLRIRFLLNLVSSLRLPSAFSREHGRRSARGKIRYSHPL